MSFDLYNKLIERIACVDEVDQEIIRLFYEAGSPSLLPKDMQAKLERFRVTSQQISRKILKMNKRLEKEFGKQIAEKTRLALGAHVICLCNLGRARKNRPCGNMKFLEIARAFILVNRIFELKRGGLPLDLIGKILVIIGSGGSIGFGIWHFFVPEAWKWYSYIEPNATELVLAVQAINVFFSLSLVLFGAVNMRARTRLNQPCSPIRNVISIHNCVVMLPYSISNHGIAGNKNQTPQNPNALF